MRHRTKLVAGSAVAVALLAGGAVRRRPRGVSLRRFDGRRVARRRSRRARSPRPPAGGTAGHDRQARGGACAGSPSNPDALASLGLAYQIRWRETGDSGYLPRSRRGARRGARRQRRDDPTATLGLGNLALIRHQFGDALVVGREARSSRRYCGAALRRRRRRADRARPLPRGVRELRAHGLAQAEPRLVRPHRVRPRAERRHRRARSRRWSSRSMPPAASRSRPPGSRSSSASSSSAAAASTPPSAHYRAALAIFPGYVYALEQRARVEAARGRLGRGGRARAPGLRRDPAAAVRRPARRPARAPGPPRGGAAPAERRWPRSTGCSSPTAFASTSSRPSTAPTTAFGPAQTVALARRARADASVDLRRRRPRLGARPRRPLRRGRGLVAAVAAGSARATRCSGSTAATPPGAPETRPG